MTEFVRTVIRFRWAVITAAALLTLGAGALATSLRIVIDPAAILPQSHPFVASKGVLENVFGEKYALIVTVAPRDGRADAATVRHKVTQLSDALLKQKGIIRHTLQSVASPNTKAIDASVDGLVVQPFSRSLDQGRPLTELLAQNPVYRDFIASEDTRTLAVFAQFEADPQGYGAILRRVQPAIDSIRDDSVDVSVGGHVLILGEIELFSERIIFLLPLAIVLIALVHFEAFRSIQGLILPLVTANLALIWVLGIMGASGIQLDVFNATTPILILAVAAGHAVQILKRYYEEYERLSAIGGLSPIQANNEAIVTAIDKVGRYMILASTVAALGFLSLMVFEIRTVKTFGFFTGLGIVSALVIELTFIPALRSMLPPPKPRTIGANKPSLWLRLTRWLAAYLPGSNPYWVWTAVSVMALAGATMVKLENSNSSNFADWTQVRKDDAAINSALAGTQLLYLMFDGGRDDALKDPAVLRAIGRIQAALAVHAGVGKVVSIVDLLRRMNKSMQGGSADADALPESSDLVAQYFLLYSLSGDARDLESYVDFNYRRANVKVFVKQDGSTYIQQLITFAQAQARRELPAGVTMTIGGGVAEAAALNQVLVHDKLLNIAQIGMVVFLISCLVFRSLVAGLLVLLPLGIAVLVNFGLLGWLGIPLNVPTSLISAMAVGIGADYAIYVIARYREEVRKGTPDPVTATLTSAGQACLYVATAVGVGYGVLGLSSGFHIHQWMALLIASAMFCSATAAITLIPALLSRFRPEFVYGR
ncbi:MAG: exporters of the superfamily-like protein [Hydrocarboniphaga sp.]|uniref:efflux RND transporter permease subunit n=1 Tax=Hydrocarboniphaga sp. TaxID=2033016 RepID=UPI002613E10F|nr:MMPL family transporter [Hydrocarboniphaga sp.]MDB5967916.1 exporters of the superfamily-like protein [Hydrocarboniphaga sp.]